MSPDRQFGSNWIMPFVIVLVTGCVISSGCVTETKEELYRVGIISGSDAFVDIADGFKEGMTELGYMDGENIVYDLQVKDADPEGERQAIEKFVEDGVDLIFAFPTEPALAVKTATQGTGIPVVFAMAGLEGYDLVESVKQPGGDITGVRFPISELSAKQVEFLHELVPEAKRVYLVYDRNYPNTAPALREMRSMASSLGITLVEDPVNDMEEFQAALQKRAALDDIGIDAILIMPDILNNSPEGFGAILTLANSNKLPIGSGTNLAVSLGSIFSFVPDNADQGKQAASLADKVFKGTPAGTIPVVTPEAHLWINYKVAKELGLNVSESLMARADEIIH
jgi:putative ABC transport system substrate-binding protein